MDVDSYLICNGNENYNVWEPMPYNEKYVQKSGAPIFPIGWTGPTEIKFNWVNITDLFVESCKDLALGELLHDTMFGLFEAMSAIEMMDPKMDAGLLCNRGGKRALSFEHAVETGLMKLDNFEDSELISIMDTTFSCIVAWLEGHSLVQTVFTNLYLHKPYEIKDRSLKVFCITVYKIVELIKGYIQSAAVFEEEDFQPIMYCYSLTPYVSVSRVFGMLKEVEDELNRRIRLKDQEQSSDKPECPLGVYIRIKLLRTFYTVLHMFGQMKKEKRDELTVECLKTINQASELLNCIRKDWSRDVSSIKLKDQPMGFEPLINQRLLLPAFPRYTKIKPSEHAYKYIEELLDRLRVICKIQNHLSLHSAIDFFIDFSRTHPCVLSRSILQLLYLGNSETNDQVGSSTMTVLSNSLLFVDVLRDACKNFIAPPSLVSKTQTNGSHMGKEYVASFFWHCIRPFTNMIQLFGHNHARQRDKLAHLLEELAVLQDEAERVDAFLHNHYLTLKLGLSHLACFGTWVLYHTLQVMIMYLLSGFELELYSPHEYYYVYWYMYEFLYGWLISALNRADNFMMWTESDVNSKNRTNKKPKIKKRKHARPYEKEILHYQALQNMCGGYYKGLLGLMCDGKMKLPSDEFSKESIRFQHRFAPFRILMTPPPVSYNEFLDMTKALRASGKTDTRFLYTSAAEHFRQARVHIESIEHMDKEIAALWRVVKWNFVVFKILAGGHRKESTSPPEFDFSEQNLFPFIKLVI